jgi:hypothetical protein
MTRICPLVALAVVVLGAAAAAQHGPDGRNMALVGHDDLQGRSAYQPSIHRQGSRWIAYIGHHGGVQRNRLTGADEPNGTSVVDVTNPREPRYLAHIPGEPGAGEAGGAQMTRVCSGETLPRADPGKVYLLRSYGSSAHEIWDVTSPSQPVRLKVIVDGLVNTHKNFWECDTGIAYVISGPREWRTRRMTKVYDLSDPTRPVFIRDFGLPGQQPGSTVTPVPTELHGPISIGPKGNRVYFGYGTSRAGVVQIVDREKLLNGPREPTDANLLYPQIARIDLPPDAGAHTAFPLLGMTIPEFGKQTLPASAPVPGGGHEHGDNIPLKSPQAHRDFIAVVSESLANECQEPRQLVRFVDITFESTPIGASTWTVPEASGDFCSRGGRFGAHASHESFTPVYYGRVLFVTFFNAGVRALDVRDPFNPREIAYYIPATTERTEQRCVGSGAGRRCKVAIQSNNVEVDDRGYVYVADRANTGLHVVELTGAARSVANFASAVP